MSNVVLFPRHSGEAALLRRWGEHDAQRLALAIAWDRSTDDEAQRELAATLAWHAERASIRAVSCRSLAASMLDDAAALLERQHNAVLQRMIAAAEPHLRRGRGFALQAATAAADIAREEGVPPSLIDNAMRLARWRLKQMA